MNRLQRLVSKLALAYQMPEMMRTEMIKEISCKCQRLCTNNVQIFDRPLDGFNKCLYHCIQSHGVLTVDTSYFEASCD